MRNKALSCLLILALLFSACPAYAGNIWSSNPAGFVKIAREKVKKGMSKQQVRQLLGRPIASTDDGTGEVWIYSKSHGGRVWIPLGLGGDEHASVTVTFKRGKVSSVRAGVVRTGPAVR
jgi:outer membrane protein assembly factor BamE (lipoprotein component of BamABCDE complex)